MHFHEVRLKTPDPGNLLEFYKEVLAFQVSDKSIPGGFQLNCGHTSLIFEKDVQPAFYHFAFNIPWGKSREALAWLSSRLQPIWLEEYKSYIADFKSWQAESVYFRDPAGNILEFISRKLLNDMADDPFSPQLIRNISEVGLVFSPGDFENQVACFLQQYELSYFDCQSPLPSFRAIGDHEGLWIVVPENRSWYPFSDQPAGSYPLSVQFSHHSRDYFFETDPNGNPNFS